MKRCTPEDDGWLILALPYMYAGRSSSRSPEDAAAFGDRGCNRVEIIYDGKVIRHNHATQSIQCPCFNQKYSERVLDGKRFIIHPSRIDAAGKGWSTSSQMTAGAQVACRCCCRIAAAQCALRAKYVTNESLLAAFIPWFKSVQYLLPHKAV
jgi:hypothetical protein